MEDVSDEICVMGMIDVIGVIDEIDTMEIKMDRRDERHRR